MTTTKIVFIEHSTYKGITVSLCTYKGDFGTPRFDFERLLPQDRLLEELEWLRYDEDSRFFITMSRAGDILGGGLQCWHRGYELIDWLESEKKRLEIGEETEDIPVLSFIRGKVIMEYI